MKHRLEASALRFLASACCIGPVASSVIGAGALGASAVALEPLRPWLMHAVAIQKAEKVAMRTRTLKVSGMTCAGCEAAVRIAARSVDDVSDVKVSYAKGLADVTYNPSKTNPAEIAKVISDRSGFKAEAARGSEEK